VSLDSFLHLHFCSYCWLIFPFPFNYDLFEIIHYAIFIEAYVQTKHVTMNTFEQKQTNSVVIWDVRLHKTTLIKVVQHLSWIHLRCKVNGKSLTLKKNKKASHSRVRSYVYISIIKSWLKLIL